MHDNDSIYALTIVAHPDDESFVFAGTALKFEAMGKKVAVICATQGEKGADRLGRSLDFFQMAKIRRQELLDACRLLHCDCKKIMNHPDGELDQVDFGQLVAELAKEIDTHQPEIILTFGTEGISGHRDHITINKAVLAAIKQIIHSPKELWLANIPTSKIEDFHIHMEKRKVHHLHFIKPKLQGAPDEQLTKIDISQFKDTKLKAISAHESQRVENLVWPEFLESEYFEIIKL